jgi:hypothetical protein
LLKAVNPDSLGRDSCLGAARIAITAETFEAKAVGGLGRFEAKANKKGERFIWLEPH